MSRDRDARVWVEITESEKEWAGVALRSARDAMAEEDTNWDGSEPGNPDEAVKAMESITSLLRKLDENEHPGFRLAPPPSEGDQ